MCFGLESLENEVGQGVGLVQQQHVIQQGGLDAGHIPIEQAGHATRVALPIYQDARARPGVFEVGHRILLYHGAVAMRASANSKQPARPKSTIARMVSLNKMST